MGDLPSVPPPTSSAREPLDSPLPSLGGVGLGSGRVPPVPLLYPNCEAFRTSRGWERDFNDLACGGWMVSGPPPGSGSCLGCWDLGMLQSFPKNW